MNQNENENKDFIYLGEVEHVKSNLWVVKKSVQIGVGYFLNCPGCGLQLNTTPEKEGTVKVKCNACGITIGYKACQNTCNSTTRHEIYVSEDTCRGCIEWRYGFLKYRRVELKLGKNVIGRKDEEKPSDISLSDPTVSRQSVSIEVTTDSSGVGYRFCLSVCNAKNPVKVGDILLQVGDSVFLHFGDTIQMGKTVLKFNPSKKNQILKSNKHE